MEFKWDISLGTVIAVITILSVYGHAATRFTLLERKMNILFNWWTREVFKGGTPNPETAADIQKFFK